ncbi:Major facilitator superfamily domain-containing protein 12 [Portunus trituberculatus]|uniref:Major facilitator superfamily domain-containing protein 12 n=1 Tax=Portunus trituberculatus TaxID=210409 RepID=A0A5B7E252_PORTR|nr:Major facilitator superfamily domain-containing protein 12 [Portunus trituberculatus]
MVLCAFPFIFMGCLGCANAHDWAQVVYYAPFVVVFQFGWAATQISHLSLIPTITQDPNDRTELNAIRYGFTVMSNVTVYLVTWLVLGLDTSSEGREAGIGPEDATKFRASYMLGTVVGASAAVGLRFGQGTLYVNYLLYVVAMLLGAGGSVMLVTSLSITADFIGPNVESGAFVYGSMSFTDKLSNGIAVVLIQNLNPCM